jgi:hypothetical protein
VHIVPVIITKVATNTTTTKIEHLTTRVSHQEDITYIYAIGCSSIILILDSSRCYIILIPRGSVLLGRIH